MNRISVTPETAAKIELARRIGIRAYQDRIMSVHNLGFLLHSQAARLGDKLYLIYRDVETRESYTYSEFYDRACRTARFLINDLGVKTGDRISTLAYNHPHTVIVYFGIWLAGGVIVPINVAEEDKRIAFIQKD